MSDVELVFKELEKMGANYPVFSRVLDKKMIVERTLNYARKPILVLFDNLNMLAEVLLEQGVEPEPERLAGYVKSLPLNERLADFQAIESYVLAEQRDGSGINIRVGDRLSSLISKAAGRRGWSVQNYMRVAAVRLAFEDYGHEILKEV